MTEIRSINALRADRKNDNTLLTPVEALQDMAEDIRLGKVVCNKLLIICLDTTQEAHYNTSIRLTNMRVSEAVALAEIGKAKLLSWMRSDD